MTFVKLQFSKRIKQLREERGWSQKELGMKTWKNLDSRTAQGKISHYETDRHIPSHEDLERLAKALEVSVLALLVDPAETPSTVELMTWNALMAKRPLSLFDITVVNDQSPPYLKDQVLRVDATLKPKHGDHVIASFNKQPPVLCEFFSSPKKGNFFSRLDSNPPQMIKENEITHVYAVIISHTIFHR